MAIMDTTFDEGGATWPKETVYQVVAIPGKLKMWFKLPAARTGQKLTFRNYLINNLGMSPNENFKT